MYCACHTVSPFALCIPTLKSNQKSFDVVCIHMHNYAILFIDHLSECRCICKAAKQHCIKCIPENKNNTAHMKKQLDLRLMFPCKTKCKTSLSTNQIKETYFNHQQQRIQRFTSITSHWRSLKKNAFYRHSLSVPVTLSRFFGSLERPAAQFRKSK